MKQNPEARWRLLHDLIPKVIINISNHMGSVLLVVKTPVQNTRTGPDRTGPGLSRADRTGPDRG